MSAPFSRLQLAAALLEYDNDPENPDAPYRSAHESALFAHLRRNVRAPVAPRRSSNLVGVALPSETASMGGRESVMDGRRSRGSTLALRNPFGEDDYLEEEEGGAEHLEVDLTSWGLDAFISKDKESKGKGKASPQPLSSVATHFPTHANAPPGSVPRTRATRSMSAGNYDHLFPEQDDNRRKSIASPLDLAALQSTSDDVPFQRRRAASYSADSALQAPAGPPVVQNIPFPSRSVRSPSPPLDRPRSHSSGTLDMLADAPGRQRSNSNGTMTSRFLLADDNNPFALEPPTRASRFDPKAAAHARTVSNASMGSRMLLDNDAQSVMTGRGVQSSRPLSTIDLLRPKVLVMPSPLQHLNSSAPPPPLDHNREGFQLSVDGPPLPPGARSTRRGSTFGDLNAVPIASNSFTPNPRMNLTLSQMTFRNTLKVDGREAAYTDGADLPRATEEGQQVDLDPTIPEDIPVDLVTDEHGQPGRPPGKLFGKSLIDDLEARKANMRNKQRQFRGDDRPSMMARAQLNRSSTLIDPASLPTRPGTQRMSSYPARPDSAGAKPLLDFEGDRRMTGNLQPPGRVANSRSVFGPDTLWEREMAKLKEIEAQEAQFRLEQEEMERREAGLAPSSKRKKKGKKTKGGESEPPSPMSELHRSTSQLTSPIASSSPPPVLPMPSPIIRGPPPVLDKDASDSEESDDEAPRASSAKKQTTDWHSESSDEDGPRRTTGVGLRYPKGVQSRPAPAPAAADDESEDDIPLSAAMQRATLRVPGLQPRAAQDSDSEEDQPLSVLIRKSQSTSLLPKIDFDKPSAADDDEDDDQPLGLRASRVAPSIHAPSFIGNGDDDELPLALHPDQQRKSQYLMMAQQQQQMMMQAQMQSSMFMNPSMMGSTFFAPPIVAPIPMMPPGPPMQIPSPPPLQDPAKFGRVDRWRRDVVVDGE